MEADPATWPSLLGGRPFERADLIDADVSTVSAAADKVIRVHEEALDWLLDVENAITDLDRLEELGERLLDVSSWQELLAGASA